MSRECHASLHFTPMSRFTSLHTNVTLHFTSRQCHASLHTFRWYECHVNVNVMTSMSRFTSLHANVTLHFTRFGDMNVTSHVSVIWMSRHQCHGNVTLHFTSHQCHASLHFTPMSRFTSLHANVTLHFTRFGDMNVTWTWMSQCHCDMNVTGMSMSRECQCHAVNVTHVVKPSAAKAERSGNGGAAVSPARLWYPLTFIYSYNAKNKSIGKTFFFFNLCRLMTYLRYFIIRYYEYYCCVYYCCDKGLRNKQKT